MDEEITIIETNTRYEKIRNFFINNKKPYDNFNIYNFNISFI